LWQALEADLKGPHSVPSQSGKDSNLWEVLKSDLILNQTPEQRPGIESKEMTDKRGRYYMLKNGTAHYYMRLSPEEFWVWQRLNGQTSVQDLILLFSEEFKALITDSAFASLLDRLRNAHMLNEAPRTLYSDLSETIEKSKFSHGFTWLARIFVTREFTIKGLDIHLERIHAKVGRYFFVLPVQITFLLITTIGVYFFIKLAQEPKYHLLDKGHVIQLGLLAYLPLVIHEFGHAITAKHFKCEVYRGGFMLYYGLPAVFVDTTDVQMFGKKEKLAVTWAGPYTGYILAGSCALLVYFLPNIPPSTSEKLLQLALTAITISTFNLLPMVKLDGYYLLADTLEIPRLRERSIEFITHTLPTKIRKHQKGWAGEERIFLAFGIFSFLSTFYFTWAGLVFWDWQVGRSITKLFNGNENILITIGNAGLAILAISSLAYSLFWLSDKVKHFLRWLESKGFLSTPGRATLVIILCVLTLILFSWFVLQQSMQGVFITSGIIALPLAAWLAWKNFRSLRGSVYRWMWLVALISCVAGTGTSILELSSIASLNLRWTVLGPSLEAAWETRLQLATIVLMVLFFIGTGRQLLHFRGGWRTFSLFIISTGIVLYVISFSQLQVPDIPEWLKNVDERTRLALRATASGLMLGGLFHWRLRPNKTELRKTEFNKQAPKPSASSREKITNAFHWLQIVILDEVELDFGMPSRKTLINGIYLATSNTKSGGNASAGMTLGELGRSAATELEELLKSVEQIGGRVYAHRTLADGYDSLSWELQEIAEDYILKHMLHAQGLSSELSEMRNDLEVLLRSVPLFISLKDKQLRKLSQKFQPKRFAPKDKIIQAGKPGTTFYVIRTGQVEVMSTRGKLLNRLGRGDYFGEAALLTNENRNATIRALTPVETLELDKKQFNRFLRKHFRREGTTRDQFQHLSMLREIPIFDQFDASQLISIAEIMERVKFERRKVIFKQGETGDSFYIVESGKVNVKIDGSVRTTLETGEHFGEIALIMDCPRTATVIAQQTTILLRLRSNDFQKFLQSFDSLNYGIERIKSRRIKLNRTWDIQATLSNNADL